ncbi:DUF1292 domain-containing protein [Novibacillus thermophilus]|uniref:DUF1292 domain-containing protein n=1 Tax=Novibacillus thermophilus TaxID=1471761 RepID=A0A1U9K5H3_9BACL|nr:DUF1292 domain-containing protein [Novibacillus thermophilus]AQS55260.1 hypothetical protein B0W44_05165 [Novibacillus thermophilus]
MNETYRETSGLTEAFGPDLILEDERGHEEHYRVVTEMEIDQQHYAVLRLHGDPDEEAFLFRVVPDGDGFIVEDVEDDDEWERAAEVYRQIVCRH